MMDRSEINRALAKALAYKQCGKQEEAERWAIKLLILLDCAGGWTKTSSGTRRYPIEVNFWWQPPFGS